MGNAKEKVVACCDRLGEKVRDAGLSADTAGKITAVAESARGRELVVPVVGAFSAGKSTLINNLLGRGVLPVDIRPETSLATELRYSPSDYILAVKENGESDRYTIEEIKTVTENAAKYQYAELHLNNPKLREIEPLVLVDMPGFDSPLDLHNKAILAYLDRGCHYVVLSSVEEGNITKSLERRLNEIEGLGRGFSFFLSKSDLRPESEIKELVAYYGQQLADKFSGGQVVTMSNSAEEVVKCLKGIDVDAVFLKLYRDTLLIVCGEIISGINLAINSSKQESGKLKAAVEEMKNSIDKIKKKVASDVDFMRRRYSGNFANEIVNEVGAALDGSLEELCGVAISGGQDGLIQHINEIVRSALSSSIREKLDGLNRQIALDFSESLQGLDKVMKDLDLDVDFIKNISVKVEDALKIAGTVLTDVLADPKQDPADSTSKAALAGVAAVAFKPAVSMAAKVIGAGSLAVPIIGPVISVLIMFLPELIGGIAKLFGGDTKAKQKEAISVKLSGEVFPSIKRRLREEIPAQLEGEIATMIQKVQEQFEVQIKNQEEIINAQMAQKNSGMEEQEAAQKKLEAVRGEVQGIDSEIRAWGK